MIDREQKYPDGTPVLVAPDKTLNQWFVGRISGRTGWAEEDDVLYGVDLPEGFKSLMYVPESMVVSLEEINGLFAAFRREEWTQS